MIDKKIHLINVRLSFPSLFKKSCFNGEEGKFQATFLLNKETQKKQIDMLKDLIGSAIIDSKLKITSDKICLKDGDTIDYAGYAGHMAFKATSNGRPTLIGRDKSALAEEDCIIYAGCYVNAVVGLWIQNNSYGRRINANLHGVQFVKDGESFGVINQDVTDDFDELPEEGSDDYLK